jgi:hypothetical protein
VVARGERLNWGKRAPTSAERIVAQLREMQADYDRGVPGAKPALDWVESTGYIAVPIPSKDEWIHRDVLTILGFKPPQDEL